MKISQSVKILIGIATIWLFVYPVLFIGFMFLMPLGFMMGDSPTFMPFTGFGIIFPLHCLTFIIQLGLMVFYLIHIIKNSVASEAVRVILGVGIFFMPYIAMPLYYYLYIWRDVPPDWATGKPTVSQSDVMLTDVPTIEELKEEEKAEPKSNKNLWIILIVVAAILLICLALAGVAYYQLISAMESSMAEFEEMYDFPPKSVPARTIQNTEDLSLLWAKAMDIEDPHKTWVEVFVPNEQSMVFWSPESETLISLDMISGETIWEVDVPNHSEMRHYDDKFFVLSYEWFNLLEDAPVNNNTQWPDCSFGGKATLLTYDPQTGEQIWGYVYRGVSSYDLSFDDQDAYLTGTQDHGSSRSIAQIDVDTGELLYLDCYRWPDQKEMRYPPTYEGQGSSTHSAVVNEHKVEIGDHKLSFVAEGTRLDVLAGASQNVIGSVYFEGADLNPWDIDVVVQDDVAVIYLGDSDQLYSFRMQGLTD